MTPRPAFDRAAAQYVLSRVTMRMVGFSPYSITELDIASKACGRPMFKPLILFKESFNIRIDGPLGVGFNALASNHFCVFLSKNLALHVSRRGPVDNSGWFFDDFSTVYLDAAFSHPDAAVSEWFNHYAKHLKALTQNI